MNAKFQTELLRKTQDAMMRSDRRYDALEQALFAFTKLLRQEGTIEPPYQSAIVAKTKRDIADRLSQILADRRDA